MSTAYKFYQMKIYNKRSELYLIVDFGASLFHTHNKESLYSFSDLLEDSNVDYKVWIPLGSEIDRINYKFQYNLFPGYNPISFSFRRISTWIPAAHGKVHNLSESYNWPSILKFLTYVNAFHFLSLLAVQFLKYKKIKIVFTTSCAFSFQTLCILEAFKIRVEAYCRLTNTAEQRGELSRIIHVTEFIKKSKEFNFVKVYFGLETHANLVKLDIENDSRCSISKFPSITRVKKRQVNPGQITISFLGYPTRDKGQEHIFPIIKNVSLNNPQFKWQVQIREKDLLEIDLKNIDAEIKIFIGKIPAETMINALLQTDIICLPYDIKKFRYNASAMMYQSADYLVPILTFSGSAFAAEIDEFGFGIVAEGEIDLIAKIRSLDVKVINKWIEGCRQYNQYRNMTNYNFLQLPRR